MMRHMEFRALTPRFWTLRQTQLAMVMVPLLLIGPSVGAVTVGLTLALVIALALLGIAATWWNVERGRYHAWGYLERADDLLVRRGLLFRQLTVVPYGRMQFIDVTAGPVERLFGLATLQMHTAAAATDARIPGLQQGEADRLRDQLAAFGESRATGL